MFTLSEKLKKYLVDQGYYLQIYYDGSGYVLKCVSNEKVFTFHKQQQLEEFIDPKLEVINIDIKIDKRICSDTIAREISKLAGVHSVKVV